MSLIVDHKVPFRSEAFLAELAMACRKIGTIPGSNNVSLQTILDELQAHGVESISTILGMKQKGRLRIELITDDPHEFPAYVKFSPTLTLFVQKSIWARFKEGRSDERVIIAHEIGHIMLHDDEAKPFAGSDSVGPRFTEDEYYAEWQANTFAEHLLIPTELAQRLDDSDKIAFTCNVPDWFSLKRISKVRQIKKPLRTFQLSDFCEDCGDFGQVALGVCRSCEKLRNRRNATPARA
jgi:hypothetical protein